MPAKRNTYKQENQTLFCNDLDACRLSAARFFARAFFFADALNCLPVAPRALRLHAISVIIDMHRTTKRPPATINGRVLSAPKERRTRKKV